MNFLSYKCLVYAIDTELCEEKNSFNLSVTVLNIRVWRHNPDLSAPFQSAKISYLILGERGFLSNFFTNSEQV